MTLVHCPGVNACAAAMPQPITSANTTIPTVRNIFIVIDLALSGCEAVVRRGIRWIHLAQKKGGSQDISSKIPNFENYNPCLAGKKQLSDAFTRGGLMTMRVCRKNMHPHTANLQNPAAFCFGSRFTPRQSEFPRAENPPVAESQESSCRAIPRSASPIPNS